MELYTIVLQCVESGEVDKSVVFLRRKDYKNLMCKINEVVYREKNREWALKEITKK